MAAAPSPPQPRPELVDQDVVKLVTVVGDALLILCLEIAVLFFCFEVSYTILAGKPWRPGG